MNYSFDSIIKQDAFYRDFSSLTTLLKKDERDVLLLFTRGLELAFISCFELEKNPCLSQKIERLYQLEKNPSCYELEQLYRYYEEEYGHMMKVELSSCLEDADRSFSFNMNKKLSCDDDFSLINPLFHEYNPYFIPFSFCDDIFHHLDGQYHSIDLEQFIQCYGISFAKENGVYVSIRFRDIDGFGRCSKTHDIVLNRKLLDTSNYAISDLMDTLFHEIRHAMQWQMIYEERFLLTRFRFIEETLVQQFFPYDFYLNNYDSFLIERDASSYAQGQTSKWIFHETVPSNSISLDDAIFLFPSGAHSLDLMVDQLLSRFPSLMNEFPLLKHVYDDDGKKRDKDYFLKRKKRCLEQLQKIDSKQNQALYDQVMEEVSFFSFFEKQDYLQDELSQSLNQKILVK